ncbi:unnamed protein product [Closterium sp. Naga37s-1]|nr:unnamed protein product [Closterium sp. Naga37s-1]
MPAYEPTDPPSNPLQQPPAASDQHQQRHLLRPAPATVTQASANRESCTSSTCGPCHYTCRPPYPPPYPPRPFPVASPPPPHHLPVASSSPPVPFPSSPRPIPVALRTLPLPPPSRPRPLPDASPSPPRRLPFRNYGSEGGGGVGLEEGRRGGGEIQGGG